MSRHLDFCHERIVLVLPNPVSVSLASCQLRYACSRLMLIWGTKSRDASCSLKHMRAAPMTDMQAAFKLHPVCYSYILGCYFTQRCCMTASFNMTSTPTRMQVLIHGAMPCFQRD